MTGPSSSELLSEESSTFSPTAELPAFFGCFLPSCSRQLTRFLTIGWTYKNKPSGKCLHDGSRFESLFFGLFRFTPVDSRLVDITQQALVAFLVGRVRSRGGCEWCGRDLKMSVDTCLHLGPLTAGKKYLLQLGKQMTATPKLITPSKAYPNTQQVK